MPTVSSSGFGSGGQGSQGGAAGHGDSGSGDDPRSGAPPEDRGEPGERGDRSPFPEDPTDPNQPPGHQVPRDTRPGAEQFAQQATGDDQFAALQQTANVIQALIDMQAQGKARA